MKKYIYLLFISLLFFSCQHDGDNMSAAFEITGHQKVNDYKPKLKFTVKNMSRGIEGGCQIFIKLKKGNTIVYDSWIVYSNLAPEEDQTKETWFSDLKSHNDYSLINATLEWESSDGEVFQKVYNF